MLNPQDREPVPFTLHVRLTRFCNAGCDYCSSWQESPDSKMSSGVYLRSLEFLYNTWNKLGISVTHLTIEYVGGEILLLSVKEITDCVLLAREFFEARNIQVHDGVQSNMIGTKERMQNLFTLFQGRVGTSIDSFSEKRKFKGSATKYKTIFIHNETEIVNKGVSEKKIPAVFTVDRETIQYSREEIHKAMLDNRDLMIRPVFGGGSAVYAPSPNELADMYEGALRDWWMNSNIRLEPMYSLVRKRLHFQYGENARENFDYCSFQSNCAVRSMSLEPNGDIYLCQDMADAGREIMGNALEKRFNMTLWARINMRPAMLSASCYSCEYFKECQGGCLLKSLEDGNGIHGKSEHCYSWKRLFSTMDQLIEASGSDNVVAWINNIEKAQ